MGDDLHVGTMNSSVVTLAKRHGVSPETMAAAVRSANYGDGHPLGEYGVVLSAEQLLGGHAEVWKAVHAAAAEVG